MKTFFLLLIIIVIVESSKPPCSTYEFLYKYSSHEGDKLICIMKCPFGCGYGDCLSDGTCECKMGATYLKHHTTGEIEYDMCNFQCDMKRCTCYTSICYLGVTCVCEPGQTFQEDLNCCMNDQGDPCKG